MSYTPEPVVTISKAQYNRMLDALCEADVQGQNAIEILQTYIDDQWAQDICDQLQRANNQVREAIGSAKRKNKP